MCDFNNEKRKLEEQISVFNQDLVKAKELRETGEERLDELSHELDSLDNELMDMKKVNAETEMEMKEKYEKKVAQINSRISKLKLENSKYDEENVRKMLHIRQA